MLEHFTITTTDAVAVVVATSVLYWMFVIMVRLIGQRALARMSSTDLATIIVLGAVIGRASLGYTPTLVAGVLAIITLFTMQAMAGGIRRLVKTAWPLNNPPILLMAGMEFIDENLRRTHLDEEELWPKLREAGIRHRSEVACVILEPTGEISVLRRGIPLDRSLMLDVRGIDHVPEDFFASEP
ncbi:MAG: DUF421 domain-containing protein [Propionibacteriaceae bacterium]|nr:DUF421 domain-containing protein [Propionibacteriaceae bacterium]